MPKIALPFRRFAIWMVVIALWTHLPKLVHADSSTANLSVFLSDPSGAIIAGAHLALRNADTNQEQQTDSGKEGAATFTFLKPGRYTLTVSKTSFADVVVDRIVLNVGDERHLQLVLKVGSAAQSVTVDASGLQINTTDASVSTVVDRKFVENIPLNGRSFQDLISMTPGVVTQSPQTTGQSVGARGDFSVNGQRTESNYYTVDGVTGNINAGVGSGVPGPANGGTIAASTALGTTQSLVSVDALQESRILGSTYSAEYGRAPGAQISFLTRSGTNDFHGTLFDYLRNNFFDANDWFNNYYHKTISPLRQNNFGGTVGGPIWIPRLYNGKNKSFFFVSLEGLRLIQPQAATVLFVPDTYMRQQAASPIKSILNAFPLQNGIDYGTASSPSLAQFIQPYSLPSSVNSTSGRVDHTFGPRLSAFFRFCETPSSVNTRVYSASAVQHLNTQTYTLGATSQVSSHVVDEFRLGYSRSDSAYQTSLDSFGGATPIDLATTMGLPTNIATNSVFYLNFTGIGYTQLPIQNPQNRARQWNVVDSLSVSVGQHQLKFGVDYLRIISPLNPASPYVYASYQSANSVLNNYADSLFLLKYTNATPVFNDFAAFAQDEWRVSSSVSLSFGLRWEVNPPPSGPNGKNAYTVQGDISNPATLTLAPQGTPLWSTAWYNFAPRLGVAWTAHSAPNWETVFRTGGGIFFGTDNELATSGYSGIGLAATRTFTKASIPVTSSQLDFSPTAAAPYTSGTVYAFPKHLQLPYTLGWNVSLEQGIGKAQSLTLSYVGSNGRRLVQRQQLYLKPFNPNFGYVYFIPNGVSSNYQALQAKFQRSIGIGLHALASYTWSHSLDFGSSDYSLPLTRGNSDFDVRNVFSGGVGWDIPVLRSQNRVARNLLNGWGIDGRLLARGSYPITINGQSLTNPATGSTYYGNANLVSGQPIYLYGSQYPGGRIVNKAAFSLPAANTQGNATELRAGLWCKPDQRCSPPRVRSGRSCQAAVSGRSLQPTKPSHVWHDRLNLHRRALWAAHKDAQQQSWHSKRALSTRRLAVHAVCIEDRLLIAASDPIRTSAPADIAREHYEIDHLYFCYVTQ